MHRKHKRGPMPTRSIIGSITLACSGEKLIFRKGEEERMVATYRDCLDTMGITAVRCKVRSAYPALQKQVYAVNARTFGYDPEDNEED